MKNLNNNNSKQTTQPIQTTQTPFGYSVQTGGLNGNVGVATNKK